MITWRSCSWCHEAVRLPGDGSPVYCSHCGHRGDLPRLSCDCPQCRRPAAYETELLNDSKEFLEALEFYPGRARD